jgi:hypothetical protein
MVMLSRRVTMRAVLCRATGTRVAVTVMLSMDSFRDWAKDVPADRPATRQDKVKIKMALLFISETKGSK